MTTNTASSAHATSPAIRRQQFLWRKFLIAWCVVFAVLLIDGIWVYSRKYAISREGLVSTFAALGFLLFVICALLGAMQIPRYRVVTRKLRHGEAAETVAWFALLFCFLWSTWLLSYLCTTVNAPLIDDHLIRIDGLFGFYWPSAYAWVGSHPALRSVLQFAYLSWRWQLLALGVFLGLAGRREDLSDFVLLMMIATLLVIGISTPLASSSAFLHFKVDDMHALSSVSAYDALRSGVMRTFDPDQPQGLVSMPSLHAMLSVFLPYVLRHVKIVFPIAVVLNGLMLLSTPTQGGHYLSDVLVGLILAVCTIKLVAFLNRRLLQPSRQ